jgi:hypothetical protein
MAANFAEINIATLPAFLEKPKILEPTLLDEKKLPAAPTFEVCPVEEGTLAGSSGTSAWSLADEDDLACIVGIGKIFSCAGTPIISSVLITGWLLIKCLGCRLPGGIRSTSGLWDFLEQKRSAQCTVPQERFNIHGFYHKDGTRAGVMNASGGYFLQEDVRQFDNSFFNISNLEATYSKFLAL